MRTKIHSLIKILKQAFAKNHYALVEQNCIRSLIIELGYYEATHMQMFKRKTSFQAISISSPSVRTHAPRKTRPAPATRPKSCPQATPFAKKASIQCLALGSQFWDPFFFAREAPAAKTPIQRQAPDWPPRNISTHTRSTKPA